MNRIVTVPFVLPLTKEKNWSKLNETETEFFIARYHFLIQDRQVGERVHYGRVIETFRKPKAVDTEMTHEVEFTQETVDYYETFKRSVLEQTFMEKYSAKLAASLGTESVAGASGEVMDEMQRSITRNFVNEFKLSSSIKNTEKLKEQLVWKYGPEHQEAVLQVDSYVRIAWDIYLMHIDYLKVKYDKHFFALRRKKINIPPYDRSQPMNIITPRFPLCCIKLWKKNKGVNWLNESEYKLGVENDEIIEVGEPERLNPPTYIGIPDSEPSLYHCSYAAFPTKWKDRNHEYKTKEELMQIELDDAKETGWWFRYGPGSW
jgi:hypothetical protein